MLRVFRSLASFDGMDEGQRFWYFDWVRKDPLECEQMHAVADEGDDVEREVETWLIENTEYTADDEFSVVCKDDRIGNLGVMMRTDETVRAMIDEIAEFVRASRDRDGFEVDPDWEAGFKEGRISTSIPRAPMGRDGYHYKCGAVCGMYERLAELTGAEFDFVKTWLMPDKAEVTGIVVAGE